MDRIELAQRLRALHPADLDALIVSFPDAGPYVGRNAPVEKVTELLRWANTPPRQARVETALARWTARDGASATPPPAAPGERQAPPGTAGFQPGLETVPSSVAILPAPAAAPEAGPARPPAAARAEESAG